MTKLERLMEAHRDGATIAYKDLLDVLEEQKKWRNGSMALVKENEELIKTIERLEADNARMREALQELYNLNLCPDYETGESRENLFADIAREALKGEG